MKARWLLLVALLLCHQVWSQISVGLPIRSNELLNEEVFNYIALSEIDAESALAEDERELKQGGKAVALRFGIPIDLQLNVLANSSTVYMEDGGTLHRLGIRCPSAKSLNFLFSEFDLPDDSRMHIYSPDKKQVLGAFTEKNNSLKYPFATAPVFSDSLVIEIYLPETARLAQVVIDKAIAGYRGPDDPQSFGSSGDCNINVACEEAANWREQINSTVLIVSGSLNNRICSGAMVNNTKTDGTPYMLTANHCPVSSSNVVIFKYESPDCSPSSDGNFSRAINGFDILANTGRSDFVLARLSSAPPDSYDAYYSGWNNLDVRPKTGTGIHHPKGDVKKISFDFQSSMSSGYYTKGDDHWRVDSWDLGTTEVISSGSPLFNENKQIVGQLHGGDASCQNSDEEDYYGKFSWSWNYFSDTTRQLKYWLDPLNSGATSIGGYDPTDSGGVYVLGFGNFEPDFCGKDSIRPELILVNNTSTNFSNFDVRYYLNGKLVHQKVVNATIGPSQLYNYVPPAIFVEEGNFNLSANVNEDWSGQWSVHSEINVTKNSHQIELILMTDDAGNETDWQLFSSSGYPIKGGGGYQSVQGGQLIRDTFCLPDGCYQFDIYDSYGDGMCCQYGKGYYLLRDISSGDTIFSDTNFRSSDTTQYFCLGDSCSIRARAFVQNAWESNTNGGSIRLEMMSGLPPFSFVWSSGETSASIDGKADGAYWVSIEDSLGCNDTLYYEIGLISGIRDELSTSKNELSLYPNPNHGSFLVSGLMMNAGIVGVALMDLQGRIVFTAKRISVNGKMEFSLPEIQEGIYLLRIQNENQVYTEKLIISK